MYFLQGMRKSQRVFATHQRSNTRRRYSASGHNSLPREARFVWPTEPNPTPYQILKIEAGHAYDRSNFNQMVKLYHPDMHYNKESVAGDVSPQTRLHRYYLIIAAHELLSNPEQRRRYDLYKLGWMNNTPQIDYRYEPRAEARPSQPDMDDRPSPMQQSPIYMSNNAFAILALILAFGYAIVSYERVRRATWREKRRMHLVDKRIVKSLYEAEYLLEGKSKDERILAFLCRRHVASGANDQDGGFLHLDKHWEQNMCRH